MYNAMTDAFIKAGFAVKDNINKKFHTGWNARLSFRTFKQLQNEGYEKFSG